jgi:hypothetical protein
MNAFFADHGVKLLGGLTAALGTIQGFIAAGAFSELLTRPQVGWLNIGVSVAIAFLGGLTVVKGVANTTAERVAAAMQTAIKTQPPQE